MRVCEEHNMIFDDTELCDVCGEQGTKITAIDDSRDKEFRLECLKLATTSNGGEPDDVLKCATDFYDFVNGKDYSDVEEEGKKEREHLGKKLGKEEEKRYQGTRDRFGNHPDTYTGDRAQSAADGQEDETAEDQEDDYNDRH